MHIYLLFFNNCKYVHGQSKNESKVWFRITKHRIIFIYTIVLFQYKLEKDHFTLLKSINCMIWSLVLFYLKNNFRLNYKKHIQNEANFSSGSSYEPPIYSCIQRLYFPIYPTNRLPTNIPCSIPQNGLLSVYNR